MSRPQRDSSQHNGGPDEETIALERALFEKRRRVGLLVRLRPWLVVVLALVLVGGGIYTVWFSGVLAVERVQVSGTSLLAPVQVRATAEVPIGSPLARVDLNAIRERVATLPEVASVRVTRAWPHGIAINVVERTAVAVVPRGNGFRGLSADGVLFRAYDARPARLPVIEDQGGAGKDALQEAARVVGSMPPAVLSRVEHVSVATIDEIKLVMRSGRSVIWGNSSQSRAKAEVLAVLIKRKSSVIDVSVPGRPTTRP